MTPPKQVQASARLEQFKPFDQLSTTGRALLDRGARYKRYAKTSVVLRKAQHVSGAYVVMGGQLRVFTLTPHGKQATLYSINPGETCVLALNCIFNDLLYPAWVEASPATEIAVISGTLYRVLFESESAVRNATVQAFSTIVFRLMAELEEIHSCTLEQRLASFLLSHASSDGVLRMTQQQIASHLGSSREVIARLLRGMAGKKYIDTKAGQVVLKSTAKLSLLVEPSRARNA